MITSKTAIDIALTYREIENGQKLLEDVEHAIANRSHTNEGDIRDAFGRRVDGLELGVPTDHNSRRLFNVPWTLARPVIQAHIAKKRAELAAFNEVARAELASEPVTALSDAAAAS